MIDDLYHFVQNAERCLRLAKEVADKEIKAKLEEAAEAALVAAENLRRATREAADVTATDSQPQD